MTEAIEGTRRWSRRLTVGASALIVAIVALLVMSFLPTSYVLEQPGPVFNTLGEVKNADDEDVPLIDVADADTYDTSGSLSLTTVQVVGNREHPLSWTELALAWFRPSQAILPIDSVFPEGETSEQRDQANAVMMEDSQSKASAAALNALGYDVPADISVVSLVDDSPAEGILSEGDRILAAEGETITDVTQLRDLIAAQDGGAVTLTIERDGETRDVEVTPQKATLDGEESWAIGVSLMSGYELPVDIAIQLNNVGGPSAGMMFALGIIDTLTPGEMTGGELIAGTGTIEADGTVGPIGGIRQKLYGARDAGNEYFLAPSSNCDEVVGHVPDGLQVISTSTLAESISAVEAIAQGEAENLPTCAAS